MNIVQFNIIKFDDCNRMIFQDCDNSFITRIMKMIWSGINNYSHGNDKMTYMTNLNQLHGDIVVGAYMTKFCSHGWSCI
jgi:hypothetical protein